jgi:hypothetical protein
LVVSNRTMGYIRTTRNLLLAILMIAVQRTCWAQFDGLTLRESEEILETLPAFKAAERHGDCPGFLPGPSQSPNTVWLQMRGLCPPVEFHGSTMIGNFQVNQSTGVVTEWPSGHSVAGTAETLVLTRTLVAQARARALSEHEAECLAREAVQDSLIPRDTGSIIERKGREGADFLFLARVAPQRAANEEWHVLVDSRSLMIFADGKRIDSSRADVLADRIRIIRESPSLSLQETIELARQVPRILRRIETACSAVVAADYGNADRRFVTIKDGCQTLPGNSISVGAVDVSTGVITEPGTNGALSTPETIHLAGEFLSRARQRLAAAEKEIEKDCSAK